MTKELFLQELNRRLVNRPDRSDIISFYYEQITDRLENGETEAEVFADINIDDVLLSLGETDCYAKERVDLNIPDPIIYKSTNETKDEPQYEVKEEPKLEKTEDNVNSSTYD